MAPPPCTKRRPRYASRRREQQGDASDDRVVVVEAAVQGADAGEERPAKRRSWAGVRPSTIADSMAAT